MLHNEKFKVFRGNTIKDATNMAEAYFSGEPYFGGKLVAPASLSVHIDAGMTTIIIGYNESAGHGYRIKLERLYVSSDREELASSNLKGLLEHAVSGINNVICHDMIVIERGFFHDGHLELLVMCKVA